MNHPSSISNLRFFAPARNHVQRLLYRHFWSLLSISLRYLRQTTRWRLRTCWFLFWSSLHSHYTQRRALLQNKSDSLSYPKLVWQYINLEHIRTIRSVNTFLYLYPSSMWSFHLFLTTSFQSSSSSTLYFQLSFCFILVKSLYLIKFFSGVLGNFRRYPSLLTKTCSWRICGLVPTKPSLYFESVILPFF